jgi:cysteine desulfurase
VACRSGSVGHGDFSRESFAVAGSSLYLDHNATAPLHPAAVEAWLGATSGLWHNPSSLTPAGARAREAIEEARETLADLLGCEPARIIFTSGATESANALARHVAGPPGSRENRPLALLSPVEHASVADAFAACLGERVRPIESDSGGVVRAETVARHLDQLHAGGSRVGIVSVMAASNESGVLEPWREILAVCRERGIPFHTDATQWLGRLPARGLGGCDWVTASGHKCGGPRGVGFLVVPEGERLRVAHGGTQEGGRRGGTEDTAGILALAAAVAARERETDAARLARAAFRDAAERRLRERIPRAVVVSAASPRLWNTLAVVLPGCDGRRLVSRLAAAGVAASTGSACSAGAGSTPAILAAIGAERLGVSPDDLRGMVRLSAGWDTTADEWLGAVEILADVARGERPLPALDLGGHGTAAHDTASREARSSAASMKAGG